MYGWSYHSISNATIYTLSAAVLRLLNYSYTQCCHAARNILNWFQKDLKVEKNFNFIYITSFHLIQYNLI